MTEREERNEPRPPAAEEYTHYDADEDADPDPKAAREAALQPGREGETDEEDGGAGDAAPEGGEKGADRA